VAFYPDIASAAVVPVAFYPVGVGVGGRHVAAGDPDIGVAVPAVVAGVPGPIAVLGRRCGDDFHRARWGRADADDNLSAGGRSKSESGDGE
jgi:hypothetical protein